MRWPDERYVKVYTRDTPDWLALGWEAHALFWELLRKSDRAGLFELGKSGTRGVSAVTGIPCEVVERALAVLLEDGCVEQHGTHLLIRNYIEAQNSLQSDKARQAKAREKARDEARRGIVNPSQGVTETPEPVTPCDSKADSVTGTESPVTPICEPSLPAILASSAIPDPPSARARDPMARTRPRTAHDLILLLKVAVEREQPERGFWNPGQWGPKDALEFLEAFGDDLESALDAIESRIETFARDPAMAPWTVKKFAANYNAIGTSRAPPGRRQAATPPSIRDVLAMESKP